MFGFKETGSNGSAATFNYDIKLDKEYTVDTFIQTVLSRTGEWGYIRIYEGKPFFDNPTCEYAKGTLITNLPESILNKKVFSAKATGGWSNMDYLLKIKV